MAETLTEALREAVARDPARAAMLVRGEGGTARVAAGEVLAGALCLAGRLAAEGVSPGDRVAILLENRPEWGVAYFGVLFSGAAAVPLDPQLAPGEVREFLSRTRAKVLVASARAPLAEFSGLPGLLRIISAGEGAAEAGEKVIPWGEALSAPGPIASPPALRPGDIASIIFTSGTTGVPKGVMLTHANFLANIESIEALELLSGTDNFLSVLPLHHAYPFLTTLVLPLFLGATITYVATLQAELLMAALREEGVTLFVVAPQLLELFAKRLEARLLALAAPARGLARRALAWGRARELKTGRNPLAPLLSRLRARFAGPRFRFFVSGGAALPVALTETFFSFGLPVLEGYGLSETAPVVALNLRTGEGVASAGLPLPGVSVRIENPDETGAGEICARGANVMAGYFEDEEATREALRGGWFHTGDLGTIDADGFIHVTGRVKEVFVLRSGKKVSSEEVRAHYGASSSIGDLAVVLTPGDERLVAVVVPKAGAGAGEVRRDIEALSRGLAPYKRVRDFVLADDLPRTRLGKVKLHEALRIYLAASRKGVEGGGGAEEPETPAARAVIGALAGRAKLRAVARGAHLELDLGLDSLARVELVSAIEERLGARIAEEAVLQAETVADLIAHAEAALAGGGAGPGRERRTLREMLSEPPPEALRARMEIEAGTGARLFTALAGGLLDALSRVLFSFETEGAENLPPGPYLLTPNHTSFLDGFMIFCAVPRSLRTRFFIVGISDFFEATFLRHLVKWMRVIPVNPLGDFVSAMQAGAGVLRAGKGLGIFPEGGRSPDGLMREFRKGAAILALELGVPVVPAYICGAFEAWPVGRRLPRRASVRVVLGKPMTPEELRALGENLGVAGDAAEQVTAAMREAVAGLGAPIS